MTIAFTAASRGLIVMTVDSSVTLEFDDHREYDKGRKSFFFSGVGCVTTWGSRDHNNIGEYLHTLDISSSTHSIVELTDLVESYITEEYRPHELNLSDVGYHVAGFDRDGKARISHVFWGFDRPRSPSQVQPKYERYDHSPTGNEIILLYNGRNDLAEVVIKTLLAQIKAGKDSRFDTKTAVGLGRFGDFVARFAGELTPEVGPPFMTYLISINNLALEIKNVSFSPIDEQVVYSALEKIGYRKN